MADYEMTEEQEDAALSLLLEEVLQTKDAGLEGSRPMEEVFAGLGLSEESISPATPSET